jgi:hypothetical protein
MVEADVSGQLWHAFQCLAQAINLFFRLDLLSYVILNAEVINQIAFMVE